MHFKQSNVSWFRGKFWQRDLFDGLRREAGRGLFFSRKKGKIRKFQRGKMIEKFPFFRISAANFFVSLKQRLILQRAKKSVAFWLRAEPKVARLRSHQRVTRKLSSRIYTARKRSSFFRQNIPVYTFISLNMIFYLKKIDKKYLNE